MAMLMLWTGCSLWCFTGCSPKPSQEQTTTADSSSTDSSSTEKMQAMHLTKQAFGNTQDGTAVDLYTLTNGNGMTAKITNYGCIVTSLITPDKNAKPGDVVLGFDSLAGYLKENPYFGAVVGRYGNRIAKGRFTLDGVTYKLATNNGPNHLHGGIKSFGKVVWQAEEVQSDQGPSLKLTYLSKDGEEGYPGNLTSTVVYTLTKEGELKIDYTAETDKATPINLTNHSYFNLSAGQEAEVLKHEIMIDADKYTVVDKTLIPTGELRPVKGTPFDFTSPHAIGERIAQVEGGYDHNFVLNHPAGQSALAARVYEPGSGRVMEVYTDQPGVQFYTGNFLDGSLTSKDGKKYVKHSGFCLETQHFPDSPNQPSFPSSILKPGEKFHSTTVYKFSTRATQ
jgi:aldose 1-epimerase